MKASAVRSSELAFAAYGLALRITRDEEAAVATLDSVARLAPDADGAGFLPGCAGRRASAAWLRPSLRPRRVRRRPPGSRMRSWGILERVALRGLTVTEAAAAVGIERRVGATPAPAGDAWPPAAA